MPSSISSAAFAELDPQLHQPFEPPTRPGHLIPRRRTTALWPTRSGGDVRWLVSKDLAFLGDPVLQEFEGQAADSLYGQAMQDFQISSDHDDESGIAFWLAQLVHGGLLYLRNKSAAPQAT